MNTWGVTGLVARLTLGSTTGFYTYDPSGNASQRINGTSPNVGVPAVSYVTDAFGLVTSSDGSGVTFGFAGQLGGSQDSEDGFVLMGHRYYDPATGRFLTRDPIGYDGGINLYSYTKNNPIMGSDANGLKPRLDAPGQVINPANSGTSVVVVFDSYDFKANQYYQYKMTLEPGFHTNVDTADVDFVQTKKGWAHLFPNYKLVHGVAIPDPLALGGYSVEADGSLFPSVYNGTCGPSHFSPVYHRQVNWPEGFGITPKAIMKPLTTQQGLEAGFVVPNPPSFADQWADFLDQMNTTIRHGF